MTSLGQAFDTAVSTVKTVRFRPAAKLSQHKGVLLLSSFRRNQFMFGQFRNERLISRDGQTHCNKQAWRDSTSLEAHCSIQRCSNFALDDHGGSAGNGNRRVERLPTAPHPVPLGNAGNAYFSTCSPSILASVVNVFSQCPVPTGFRAVLYPLCMYLTCAVRYFAVMFGFARNVLRYQKQKKYHMMRQHAHCTDSQYPPMDSVSGNNSPLHTTSGLMASAHFLQNALPS